MAATWSERRTERPSRSRVGPGTRPGKPIHHPPADARRSISTGGTRARLRQNRIGARKISRDNNEKLVSYRWLGTRRGIAEPTSASRRKGWRFRVMTVSINEGRNAPAPTLRASARSPHERASSPSHGHADHAARGLPPELAFLAAEGFPSEPLLNAVSAAPKTVLPVDQLLSEGKITEEVYYRALASHLGCQYYSGSPPFARAFDAVKGLRCGVAPLEAARRGSPNGHRASRQVRRAADRSDAFRDDPLRVFRCDLAAAVCKPGVGPPRLGSPRRRSWPSALEPHGKGGNDQFTDRSRCRACGAGFGPWRC